MSVLLAPAESLPPMALNYASPTASRSIGHVVKPKELIFKDGTPVVSFTSEEISALASPFALTLIGKFSNYVPHIADIAPALLKLKLRGRFHVSFLDSHHLVIRLFNEADFNWLWLENSMFISSCYMRLFKWSPLFVPTTESPIVPIWVTLKKVPIMLFSPDALFEIVKPLGKLLKIDSATTNLSRLDRAQVCVELDVSKPRHEVICVDLLANKVNIKVIYDSIPLYCDHCHKHGHEKSRCFVLNPCLKFTNKDLDRGVTTSQPLEDDASNSNGKRDETGVEVIMDDTESEKELEFVEVANDIAELATNMLETVEVNVLRHSEEEVEKEDGVLLSNRFGALADVDIEEDLAQAQSGRLDLVNFGHFEKARPSPTKVAPPSSRPPRQAKSRAVANLAVWTNAILGKRTPMKNHPNLPLIDSVIETPEEELSFVSNPSEKDGLHLINDDRDAPVDVEENPFGFENYFEPDPGESDSGEPDADEDLLLKKRLSMPTVFEPCNNKHNRRKSEGSSPYLADHFNNLSHHQVLHDD